MQTYELLVANRAIHGNSEDMSVVRNSIGVDRIHVMFDNEEWLGFAIEAVFAVGDTLIVVPLDVAELDGSEWVAEAECDIPWEVIASDASSIRVTFRGIDAETGNYIITEYAAPIAIDQSGDTGGGDPPEGAPTLDQYTAAYAAVVAATQRANSIVAVQSDWSQGNSAANDFVKNRPFYDEETMLLDSYSLPSAGRYYVSGPLYLRCGVSTRLAADLIAGETYTVTIDGTAYEVTAEYKAGVDRVLGGQDQQVYEAGIRLRVADVFTVYGKATGQTTTLLNSYLDIFIGTSAASITIERAGDGVVLLPDRFTPASVTAALADLDARVAALEGNGN